MGGL
ncbi:hypothetical protein YPPY103_1730, partial [Yersinia pestis PY-103]|jgi:hypothetical protein